MSIEKMKKHELIDIIKKVQQLCDIWDETAMYLPNDPKKLSIMPVYQLKDIVYGRSEEETAQEQINTLTRFIINNYPGEHSQYESSVNTAIHLLKKNLIRENRQNG